MTLFLLKNQNYSFSTKGATIRDINGKKINVSNLSVGDRITITNKNEKIQRSIAMSFEGHSLENLQNIKKIKVLDKNLAEQESIKNKNMAAIKRGIILKVNDHSLDVMGAEDTTDIFSVTYINDKNVEFRQGQEILIYFNGFIDSSSHLISNVGKIEVIKEKSDISIPEETLKSVYNSNAKIDVSIIKLTKTGISFTIQDYNELHNNYSNTYKLMKKHIDTQNFLQSENISATSIRRQGYIMERSF